MQTIETLQAEINTLNSDWKQFCQAALPHGGYESDLEGYASHREAVAVLEEKIEVIHFKRRQEEREKAKPWRNPELVAQAKAKAAAFLKDAEHGLRIWSWPSLEDACVWLPRNVESFARRAYRGARERNVRVITIYHDGDFWRSTDRPDRPF